MIWWWQQWGWHKILILNWRVNFYFEKKDNLFWQRILFNNTWTDIFHYERETHAFARCRLCKSDGHLLDGAPTQGVPFPLSWKQPQLLLLILAQAVAVADAKYVKIGRQQGDKMVRREWRVKKVGHSEIKERERGKCTWDAGGHGWCCDEGWWINIKMRFVGGYETFVALQWH